MGPDPARRPATVAPLWIALGVPVAATLLLAWVELGQLDRPLFFLFNALPGSTGPRLWAHLTILGDGLVAAVLLLPWIRRHPERVWGGLLGAVGMVLVLRVFKGMLSLPRPLAVLPEDSVHIIGPGHRRGSFPSGHTATFFLYAGVWALTTRRRVLSLGLVLLALLVGTSRVAVGVHWPSDVMGGALLGWGMAWVGLRAAHRWTWGTEPTGRRVLGGALLIAASVLLVLDYTGYPGILLMQRSIALVCLVWGAREIVLDARGPIGGGFPPPSMGD